MNLNEIKFVRKILSLVKPQIDRNVFLLGQASIIASRSSSQNFKDLWDAEVKVYSQWGEDGILDFLCERLDLIKPKVVEIGAGNFKECNSRFLMENRSASVFAVDGRVDLGSNVLANPWRWKTHLSSLQEWVTPFNIQEIIKKAKDFMGGIDILSLDLDGNDYWILSEANLERISIIVVEYNPLFGPSLQVTVPRDDYFDRSKKHFSHLYYGASLPAFRALLAKKGFCFIGTNRVGNNAFFVNEETVDKIRLSVRKDFSDYTDWRVREARNQEGRLSFLSGLDRLKLISGLPLINLENNSPIKVGEAWDR